MPANNHLKTASSETRCAVCSRFIPAGYKVRVLTSGDVQCLHHPHGTVSIDKGQSPQRATEYTTPTVRRGFTRMEIVNG